MQATFFSGEAWVFSDACAKSSLRNIFHVDSLDFSRGIRSLQGLLEVS